MSTGVSKKVHDAKPHGVCRLVVNSEQARHKSFRADQIMQTLIFSVDDARHVVEHVGLDRLVDEVIGELTVTFRQFDESKFDAPARSGFDYDTPAVGLLEWMPAMEDGRQTVIKVVGYHPSKA